jgi:hypothetical protein
MLSLLLCVLFTYASLRTYNFVLMNQAITKDLFKKSQNYKFNQNSLKNFLTKIKLKLNLLSYLNFLFLDST